MLTRLLALTDLPGAMIKKTYGVDPVPRSPLRARIHLNLAKPERAENAVKVQSPHTGAWITVGYATQLLLEQCVPAVDLAAQEKIRQGSTRKVPHAFIEGNLVHFHGRLRTKAPKDLLDTVKEHLVDHPSFLSRCQSIQAQDLPINYNPRFARCFYRHQADRATISQRFERCQAMAVVGWNHWVEKAQWSPLTQEDRCEPEALSKTKLSETLAIRRGRATTQTLSATLPLRNPSP